jgi:flagellum-specific peptidoglycan hydrolase FlgJ
MKPVDFVKQYLPYAEQAQSNTGISAVAILAQAALESGWAKYAPGNMFFGVKDHTGDDSKRQLLTTTEYHKTSDVKYPEIISVTFVGGLFKYKVKDWFRKYETPGDCFIDHGNFILKNPRYKAALEVKHDPILFLTAIAKAGYATDPTYAKITCQIARQIQALINE